MLFAVGFVESITSYAISIWFFSKKKDTTKLDLQRCYKDTTKFHIGSIAILTLIKIIFKPIRLISRPLYTGFASSNQKNFLIRFLQVLCMPCIWVHHKLLRFMTKASLIHMNLWSSKYTVSSKQSYYLRHVRHGDRGEGNEELIEFVLKQLKMSISLFGSFLFYLYTDLIPYSPSFKLISDVADPLIGSLFVFCFGIFLTSAYTGCYDMIIRTIVQCNFIDEEMFVGEQKFTEPFLDELMSYWKKNDDDDLMNANAKREKKKDLLKDKLDLEDQYKMVPEGEEEIDNGPSSEEDNEANDMFAESKKRKFNKEQDFDDEFMKPKAKLPVKEPAKPDVAMAETTLIEKKVKIREEKDAEQQPKAEFIFRADEESGNPDQPAVLKKRLQEEPDAKKRVDVLFEKSDESFEMKDGKRSAVIRVNEHGAIEADKKPKPILKSSAAFDDNVSMKSSISKKTKKSVAIREGKSVSPDKLPKPETKPEIVFLNNDDDKISIGKTSKKSSLKKKTGPKPEEKQPEKVFKFKADDEDHFNDGASAKVSIRIKKNQDKPGDPKKEPEVDSHLRFREDDNASMKSKAKKSKPELQDHSDRFPDDESKSLKIKLNKTRNPAPEPQEPPAKVPKLQKEVDNPFGAIEPPKKPVVEFKNRNNDDNPFAEASDLPARGDSKPPAEGKISLKPRPKPTDSSNKQSALDKLLADNKKNKLSMGEFEDDFLNVVDKPDKKIEILNASQGTLH